MKHLSYLLAALLFVMTLSGCDNGPSVEPEIPTNPEQSAVQMLLKGSIAKPTTRLNDTGFSANDKVGIYVSSSNSLSSSGNMLNNEAFTYDQSGNITAPEGKEIFWNSADERLSVWAYYPYAENISNPAAHPFTVASDQSATNNFFNSVFITAHATDLAPQTNAVNLTFNHALSKLDIIISSEDELATDKEFSIDGLIVDGTIDIATGTATAGTTTATITPLANNSKTRYSAVVYPQQSTITFNMEMDGQTFKYTTDVELEAGYQYAFTLIIDINNPQQISLSTNSVIPWEDGESHTGTMSDIINIADDKFKQFLLNEVIYEKNDQNQYVATDKKIDANNDGEISSAEAKAVKYIRAIGLEIADLSGIEHFVNVEVLNFWNNKVTTVDISKNKALQVLYCHKNQLSTLDVSNNTALFQLWCHQNRLSTLDVTKNTELTSLYCDENQLSTLDVSKNLKLKNLSCYQNQLAALDVSKNTELTILSCEYNQLTSLDVTKNTELTSLSCGSNELLTALDITKNTKLTYLACTNCPIEVLDVTQNTALKSLYCRCQLSTLDLSNCAALEIVDCWGNLLTTLDVSNHTALKRLLCSNNLSLSSLNIANCTALEELYCSEGQLTTIDVSTCPALKTLYCSQLTDDNGNNYLTKLYLANGQSIETMDKPEETVIEYK